MSRHVERLLGDIGQSLRPMSEAPRDGRGILAKAAAGFVVCHWDADPVNLAGPSWVETREAKRGYLDNFFIGWLDPAGLKLWDYATLADLLVAFVDDAIACGNVKTLEILNRRATADLSRDNSL